MFKYIVLIFTVISWNQTLMAQKVQGMVMDTEHQPLIGASVVVLGTDKGAITNIDGHFEVAINDPSTDLVISYVGYLSDTICAVIGTPMHIMLETDEEQLGEVTITSSSTFIDHLEPIHSEVITEKELTKAACCNLSESFETNASVDVSYSDAVTGTKVIRMLGLDGRYVQINRENIPYVRGLIGRNGLSFVPGTWIQSIDVGKGAGTVVNGYESMSGQINLEFKKPNSEKLYLNAYVNSFGRLELNANHSQQINDRWKTAFLLHSNYFNQDMDRNHDGFMDMPRSKQINALNRYEFRNEKMISQIGLSVLRDETAGGQLGFDFNSDPMTSTEYGYLNKTTRLEVFGKTGLLFPHKPYKGWGFIYSGSYLNIDGGYGRNHYDGTEKTFYANTIYQNIIGNTFHQYKTGVSFLLDDYNENYILTNYQRREIVPGVYYEYTYLPNEKFTLVAGSRIDFHNLYGTYFTPRIHSRYQLAKKTTLRATVGRGYRTPNIFMENSQVLVSSRQLIIQEASNPEIAWNTGLSVVTEIPIGAKKLQLTGDYFYTYFENQLIYDIDQNSSELHVYNLKGDSYAHSFQLEGSYEIAKRLNIKAAYKLYDVKSTINGELRQVPYTAKDRVFVNLGYETKFEKWQADATVQWFGRKRLPNTSDKLVEFQRSAYSPNFMLLNAQLTRNFRWGGIYLGGENLLNYTQKKPIIDPENPFGNNFDASIIWASITGRMIYAGFRYKIKQ